MGAANSSSFLLYLIPFGLCLVGFHGIFFYSSLWKKTASWVSLHLGLVSFLWAMAPAGNALTQDFMVLTAASALAVGALLSVFCARIGDRPASSPRRDSK